jgi:hypothetical protein
LSIYDSLRDDMLYLISRSDTWYADIVNFMVTGYVPPCGDKRKLIYESRVHLWDDPYLFRIYSDGLLLGILNANRKIRKAHGYRCSFHLGVFQGIDFPQETRSAIVEV